MLVSPFLLLVNKSGFGELNRLRSSHLQPVSISPSFYLATLPRGVSIYFHISVFQYPVLATLTSRFCYITITIPEHKVLGLYVLLNRKNTQTKNLRCPPTMKIKDCYLFSGSHSGSISERQSLPD